VGKGAQAPCPPEIRDLLRAKNGGHASLCPSYLAPVEDARMTKNQVKEILDRVLTWPPDRQADVVHVVEMMEEQDSSGIKLSDGQAAEVRRRLVEADPKSLTLAEFDERLRLRYGV
jgi:hypothetical protein